MLLIFYHSNKRMSIYMRNRQLGVREGTFNQPILNTQTDAS